MPRPAKPAPISYAFYPHIVETILSYCDYATLLRFRATCQSLKIRAHRALHDGNLIIDVDGSFIDLSYFIDESDSSAPPPKPSKTPTVIMGTALGILPFRCEADWTWACEHSHTVEIDGACLSTSTHIVPHSTEGFIIRRQESDSRNSFPRRPRPSSAESVTMQAGLLRAIARVPRTASAQPSHTSTNMGHRSTSRRQRL